MQVSTDQELTHVVTDAVSDTTPRTRDLIIQPDLHGLTVEFPNGEVLTVDLSKGVFNIYLFEDRDSGEPDHLGSVS